MSTPPIRPNCSQNIVPPQTPPRKPTHSDVAHYVSTVTSCRIRSIFSWIPALINQIWLTIKALLTCCRYPHPDHTVFVPEVDPEILSEADPFHQILFNSDGKLRHMAAYTLSCEIFDILGTGGVGHWTWNLSTINQKKEEIAKSDIHPLEGLYFLFDNQEMTKNACYFLDSAPGYVKTRFLNEYADKFKEYRQPIQPDMLPGFCALLGLEETHVEELAKDTKWQDLIEYVYQTRKKHFNL